VAAATLVSLVGCGGEPTHDELAAAAPRARGVVIEIRDTVVSAVLEVAGIARPVRQATLSTRLAGSVLSVSAQEGQVVSEGQVLARLDDRDLVARREQTSAAIAEAEAVMADARVQADRFGRLLDTIAEFSICVAKGLGGHDLYWIAAELHRIPKCVPPHRRDLELRLSSLMRAV
jgi:multidrug efflux pump subunit AcrA (membrane-fusion protein)